ncbi:MAG: molybdopterin cofactor-binding domain-containing protein [Cyclobacteriaceae bacterium]
MKSLKEKLKGRLSKIDEKAGKSLPPQNISRRNFFKKMGAGIATYVVMTDVLAFQVLGSDAPLKDEDQLASWIHLSDSGKVTVFTGKVEVGQNIRTSLSQVVAEELSISIEHIELIMGDTQQTPYDRGTYGSLTTPQMAPILRKAAANLREMLLQQAKEEWKLGKVKLELEKGFVHHPSNGGKLSYGDLAKGKQWMKKMDEEVPTVDPEAWKTAGTSVRKVNGIDFITGTHRYVSDMSVPGMVYGKILRPPYIGAKLKSVNTGKAAGLDGVEIVQQDDFVGVTAKDSRTASVALAMIEAEWETSPQLSGKDLFSHLVNTGKDQTAIGNALESEYLISDKQLDQEFLVQYIAHVPLEPRAGLALWKGDELQVWTGTQRPFGVQEELQRTFDLPKEKIRVYMPDTGSGYGGKHTGEAGIEAARLAKAVKNPVKVNWTREEEFKWAYFRPAGVIRVKASTQNGHLSAWDFHNFNSGGAAIEAPYEIKEKNHQYHSADSPLRQGSYRALASTANVFAIEAQINDLASANQKDPLEFRLTHLKNERLSNLIKITADAFGWGKRIKRTNIGFGMACGAAKGGYVATFAEVKVDPDTRELEILKVTGGFECGAILNPRHLKSQVVGCMLQGLGGALFESVEFDNGDIKNASLSSYRVPRFKDTPKIEVILVDRKDLPSSGAGEAPIIGIAPAIRNAIFDATGVKINQLPMLPNGLVPVNS